MASKTFHPFPRLPRELRDEVWEFAVLSLPRRGRAHFFTLFCEEDRAALVSAEPVVMCPPNPNIHSWYHLAAPQCSGPGRLSWIDSNPSAYLCEIGLWGACRESREIMQKRFMPINWFDWGHPERSPEIDQFPALGAFSWNGQCQKFTVYPQSDLLCLQPFNFDNIDWEYLDLSISSHKMGMGHMALVYDPEWELLLDDSIRSQSYPHVDEKGPLRCISRAASNLCNAGALWFIDYRIHRRPGTIPEANRNEFYGNSCKYVEVLPSDTSWEMDDSIFWFLKCLDDLLEEYYEELEDEYDGYESERSEQTSYRVGQPSIGVLACEIEER
ncbi:hypothetical protein QBC46DRAFT_400381 [Diplogelasinospora grovesii]|uniref:2EXR domain-containing protein n=1 Tax=Diplogelasinospora grovesii TaxID=303347 RepID=A0AAN6RZ74_9PEZI|nr:hypothetical protein QBC46DRAFT_400381 [Diplogelasinospora grovesii]